MAVVTKHFVFCHLPKCGGQFVRHVLQQLNIDHDDIGEYHASYARIKHLVDDKLASITNIRHPLTWYQSRWHHRVRIGWVAEAVEDWACASNDFNQFVRNMIKFDPNGRLSTIIKSFDDGPSGVADFVLRQESLMQDLFVVLKRFYTFNEEIYWSLKPINISGSGSKNSSTVATYDDFVKDQMIKTEQYVIDRYYYGLSNPNNLSESFVI